jgi:hypothetical protein
MARYAIETIERRSVRVYYEVEAASSREALDAVKNGKVTPAKHSFDCGDEHVIDEIMQCELLPSAQPARNQPVDLADRGDDELVAMLKCRRSAVNKVAVRAELDRRQAIVRDIHSGERTTTGGSNGE